MDDLNPEGMESEGEGSAAAAARSGTEIPGRDAEIGASANTCP